MASVHQFTPNFTPTKTELSWEDIMAGRFPTPAPAAPAPEPAWQRLYREAVSTVALRAKAALPESHGRIDKAVEIVMAGDVDLIENGTKGRVASQSNGTVTYLVVNGTCECKDFARAPMGQCKHRLAYGIHKRATDLTTAQLAELDEPTPEPEPEVEADEAPTGHTIPAQFVTEIQGRQFVQFAGLLAMAHQQGLQSLKADFITVTGELALAHAVATFADGRTFEESGDATPANVSKKVAPHFARMALTRAKARALRDALNISMAAVEELAD